MNRTKSMTRDDIIRMADEKEIERLRAALRDIATSKNSMYQESQAKLALGEHQNTWRMCGLNTDDVIKMAEEAGIVMSLTDERVTLNKLNRFLELHLKALVSEGYRKCAEGQWTTKYCGLLETAVKAEREACAKVAESYEPRCEVCPSGVSNAIRARRE